MNAVKKVLLVFVCCRVLTACDAEPEDKRLISEIVFDSPYLAECVKKTAEQLGVIHVSKLTSLSCRGKTDKNDNLYADSLKFGDNSKAIMSTRGLTEFKNLSSLDLSNNWISDLDFSKLPKLTRLYIDNNIIQDLNLSQNRALYELSASCNPLSRILLSSTDSLGSIVVNQGSQCMAAQLLVDQEADFWQNRPDLLDKRTNKKLSALSFEGAADHQFNFSIRRRLAHLELGGFNIVDLKLDFPAENYVRSIKVTGTSLTELDLSTLRPAEELNVSGNRKLSKLKFHDSFYGGTLSLADNDLDESVIPALKGKSINYLDLAGNPKLAGKDIGICSNLTLSGDFDSKNMRSLDGCGMSQFKIRNGTISNFDQLKLPYLKTLILEDVKFSDNKLRLPFSAFFEYLIMDGVDQSELAISSENSQVRLEISRSSLGKLDLSMVQGYVGLSVTDNAGPEFQLIASPKTYDIYLGNSNWKTLTLDWVTNSAKLTLVKLPISKVDLHSDLKLASLSIYALPNITELDLTAQQDSLEGLQIESSPINNLIFEPFAKEVTMYFSDLSTLNAASRARVESYFSCTPNQTSQLMVCKN